MMTHACLYKNIVHSRSSKDKFISGFCSFIDIESKSNDPHAFKYLAYFEIYKLLLFNF